MINSNKKTYSIQEVARILKVSTKTLRRWEERGIIVPVRTSGGHRRYTIEEIHNLKPKQIRKHKRVVQTLPTITTPIQLNVPANQAVNYTNSSNSYVPAIQSTPTTPSPMVTSAPVATNNTFIPKTVKQPTQSFFKKADIAPRQKPTRAIAFLSLVLGLVAIGFAVKNTASFLGSTANNAVNNSLVSNIEEARNVLADTASLQTLEFNINIPAKFNDNVGISGELSLGAGIINSEADTLLLNAATTETEGNLAIGGISISFGTDVINDFTGTGIALVNGALTTSLGTSISTDEIDDGTINEVDLNASNDSTNGQILSYDSSTGGFTWVNQTTDVDTNLFTDAGDVTYLTSTTDDLTIGSSLNLGKIASVGDSDEIQLLARGNTTQTSNIFEIQNSLAAELFSVNNSGDVAITGTVNLSSAPSGSGIALCLDGTDNIVTCASGTGITGAGTNGTIAKFTSASSIGDSLLSESGSTLTVAGDFVTTGDISVNGGDITTTAATTSIFDTNATTINFGGSATTISFGANSGTTTFESNVTINGTLTTAASNFAADGATVFTPSGTNDVTMNLDSDSTFILNGLQTGTAANGLCLDASNNVITCSTVSTVTLQTAYGNDADGSDTIISLTSADDSLVVRNPSSGGTNSGYTLQVDQLASDSTIAVQLTQAGTGTALEVLDSSTGNLLNLTSTGALTTANGLAISASNAGGIITNAINVSDAEIVNALNVGANTVTGTTAVIDFTNFDVDGSGNITINSAADLTIGSIGLNDAGSDNITSGASLIGVFDEFANSNSTVLQDVLDDLDAAIAGSGYTGWDLAADAGTPELIDSGETANIVGGTNGVDTVVSATDTLTINLDTTEIGSTTFGSGSGITWTFDASGGTDTTIAFGNNTQTFTTATATFSGNATVQGTTGLTLSGVGADLTVGSIGLNDVGSNNVTSGGSLVGLFDEFTNSSATTVQDVLDDLDAAIGAGASKWTDGGAITYLTSTTDDFAVGASNTLTAPFSVDVSANLVRVGTGSTSNAQIELYGSDGDTGSLIYTTSDQFNFSGGDILASQALTITGTTTANGAFTLGDNGDTGSINTSDWDISTTGDLTGVGSITADGAITATTDETINGVDISAGTITDVVNLTINTGGDITIGAIGLNDVGSDNITSGASLVGVFDEFTNSSATTVQDVLDDLDAAISTGSFTSLTLSGDSGSDQTISSGDTIEIAGGTNGIDTVGTATDTIVLNLDTTEIGSTTFGSGSGITWTFDASGGTDTTIAFGNNTQTFTTATATFSGNATVQGTTGLTLSGAGADLTIGSIGLNDVGSDNITSGASLVGVFDELANSASTTLQDVLDDLDAAISAASYTGWTLSDGSTTETIDSGNTVTVTDSSTINATVSATDTLTLNVIADSLDFTELTDTLSLDADTSIAAGAAEEITYNKIYTNNTGENGIVFNFTASDTGAGTTAQYGMYLDNLASTEGLDASLVIDNSDADDAVGAAIRIINAGGNFTSILDIEGTLLSGVELGRLDGKDAALVDTNDAVATAITGTGALNSGSITSGFGTIDTGADDITTTGAVNTGTLVATSTITAATNETINGIDISAGTVSDIVNLTINSGGDLTIGSIGLNDVGSNNVTSGASLVGVFDEFDNSASTTVQDVLDDLDAAIGIRTYTEDNYVTDGESLAASIDALDQQLADVTGSSYLGWDLDVDDAGDDTIASGQTVNIDAGANITLNYTAGTNTLEIIATDTDTTYSAGNDLDLTGTVFSLETTLDFVDTINLAGTGTLNGLDAVDATGEDTIEALIFDADAESITGVWTVADNTNFRVGTGGDLTFAHNGTNTIVTSVTGDLIIDNTLVTGSTIFDLGTDTSATDLLVRNDSGTQLFSVNGAGSVQIGSNGQDGQLILYNELGGTDRTVTFNPSGSQSQDVTYTLPPDDGTTDYVLTTNGSGVLTWEDVTAVGGAGDITAVGDVTSGAAFTSGGSGNSLFFNNNSEVGELVATTLTDTRTWTLPDESGDVCLTSGNCAGVGGTGDVVGPATATDHAIARFDGTTGKLLQNSAVTIDDSGNLNTSGTLVAATNETINGIDISAGTVTDVVNLTINSGGDLTIGSIGLNDVGSDNITSGASLVGVFDEFTYSSATTVQDVLDDLDAQIGTLSGSAYTGWDLDGDTGTAETIANGNTALILGGTNGIDTVVSATDTLTINLDTTEIGTTTFGSGSGITWTFDAGATDPTIAFGSDTINLTAGTTTATGALTVTGTTTLNGIANIGDAGDAVAISGTTVGITSNAGSNDITLTSADDILLNPTDEVTTTLTAGGQFIIDGATTDSTNTTGSLRLLVDSSTTGGIGFANVFTAVDDDAADTLYANRTDVTIQDDTTASDTVYGNYIGLTQNDTTPATAYGLAVVAQDAGTSEVTAGILVENLQATDIDLTDGILVRATTNDSIVDGLDVSDAEIINAINIGANAIAGTNFAVTAAGGITIASGQTLTIGTTGLSETTAANDSGAFLIGIFDEFDNSASSTVQDVLDDLDAAIGIRTYTEDNYVTDGQSLAASIDALDQQLADVSAGTYTGWDLDGDTGTAETIANGNTALILGGTNGIDTVVSATDTLTINLDTTEIGTTTFGSGSGITWTFDAGTTDPTIAFGDNTVNITAGTTTATGALTVTGTTTLNGIANIGDAGDAITLSGTDIVVTSNGAGSDVTITAVDDMVLNIADNGTNSYDLQQGGNNYININTTNSSENVAFGNATTNPSFSFLGSGTATFTGSIVAATDETINGIDISAGTVTDVVNLTINSGGDLTIGSIGLNDVGSDNITSGASLVGVFDEFGNSASTTVQDVLDDLDAAITSGAFTSLTLSGDSGSDQTITNSDTIEIAGGTNGIDTVGTATDTITINLDTTEIGTTTFGSGSGITWTFDAGATDPTIAFGSNTITATAGTFSVAGNADVSGTLFAGTGDAFQVSSTGAVTAVGVNSGSGLIQGTGGLTVTGTAAINATGTAGTSIGNATGTFALASNGGLNVTTGGALTGVASIDTISTSATALGFAGAGTITSAAANALTLDSGSTGTINIGTGTAGKTINIGTSNSNADSINIGSALDTTVIGGTTQLTDVTSGTETSGLCIDASNNIVTCSYGGGTMSSFIAAGDAGGGQTIADGNTLSILGGTNGIDTIDSATDTITLNLDTTEIGTTTFGSGSGVVWTFDASGGTDTTLTFGNNTLTATAGTFSVAGNADVSGTLFAGTGDAFQVSSTGAVTAVGVNSGSGLIQGTGGLTITGATSINASGSANTNIGTGTSTGTITIGLSSGTDLALADANWNVTGAGAANFASIGAVTPGSGAFTTLTSTGITTIGNNTATVAVNSSDWDISTTGDASGFGAITADGAIAFTPGSTSDINFTLDADSFLILGGVQSGTATSGLCLDTDNNVITCSTTGAVTLQTAYGNDGDGSDTIVALTTADDSLIFRNPASSGTDSGFLLNLDQLATGAVDVARFTQAGTGVGLSLAFSNAGTTADGLLISNSAGTLTDAIDVSDATGITNAINVGPNTILGTTAAINLTNFDVDSAGNVTVAAGQGIDTNASGILAVGNTTATTVNIGGTAATTLNLGAGGALTRAINIGTGTGADTISIGTGATAADALTFGNTAVATTFDFNSGAATVDALDLTFNSITTANAVDLNSNVLTTGIALNVASTSTALTSGKLASFDWSPTTTTATGDLVSINIGANGTTTGNLFNVTDTGSSLFAVSETAMTANVPASFNAPGDVSMAYDLQFTNQTSSFIKSKGPLYVEAGESFESNDLTLRTNNSGKVVLDNVGLGYATLNVLGKSTTGDPATCEPGDIYFNSNDATVRACTATDTWEVLDNASGGLSSFTAAGDSGGGQSITDSNTLSILGGTNGIDTVDSVTDTITINLDTTEIGTTTFGAGSGITWTFNASGGTDTTIAFGDNLQTFTTASAVFSGDLTVTGGDITGANAETIDIGEADNGSIIFAGAGETNNESIEFDFETNTYPTIESSTATIIGIDEDLQFVGAQTISTSTGDLTIDTAGGLSLADIVTASANINANGGLDIDDAFVVADGGILTTSQTANFDGSADFDGDVLISDTSIAFDGASTTFVTTGAFTLTPGGSVILGDGGDTMAISTSDWAIDATGAITGVSFDANGSGNSITNIESADILDNTLTASDLNATLTFADGDFLDLAAILHDDTASQGFRLPQSDLSAGPATGEGYLAFDTDDDLVKVWTGGAWTSISGSSTTLQQAYDAGNTITTDATGDIAFTLAELGSPTKFSVTNQDTAGASAVEIDNAIASGTLTSGLFVEQSGAGTMTSGVNVTSAAGTITNGILIADGAGAITTGLSMTGTLTTGIDLSGAATTTDLILDDGLTIAQTSDLDLDLVEGGLTLNLDFGEAAGSTITYGSASNLEFESTANTTNALVFESTVGGINIFASGASAGEDISITATGSSVNLTSTEAIANAILLNASNAAGGIDINAGTGDIDIDLTGTNADFLVDTSAGAISLDAIGVASNFSLAADGAADDLTIAVTGAQDSSLHLSSAGTGADALTISTTAGGIDITAAGNAGGEDLDITATGTTTELRLTSASTQADAVRINASAGGIDIDAANSTLTINNAADGAADDLTIAQTGAQDASLHLSSAGTGLDALTLSTSAGGIDITVAGAAAGEDLDLISNTAINLTSSEAANDAIVFTTSNAAGGIDIISSSTTVDALDLTFNALTTGLGIDMDINALTSGTGLDISSTSTTLTSGRLASLDWSPGSTLTATGDLFRINIGTNGSTSGYLFNITDNGSTLFNVSESQITSTLPHQFNAAGDVSVAYDIVMTNQTASVIKSNGPFTVEAGESFENNNLTLRAYGTGSVLIDSSALALTSGENLVLDSDDSSDSYLEHNNASNYISVFIDGSEAARFLGGASESLQTDNAIDTAADYDIAETYPTFDESLKPGDLVAIDNNNDLGIPAEVGKANSSNSSRVLGIVSTSPAYTMGAGDFAGEFCSDVIRKGIDAFMIEESASTAAQLEKNKETRSSTLIGADVEEILVSKKAKAEGCFAAKQVLIALAGRVPTKISSANGSIKAGDHLAISANEPGVAVKATSAGITVGVALEDAQPEDEKIMVFVNRTWFDPNTSTVALENGSGDMQTQITEFNTRLVTLESAINNQYEGAINTESLNATDLTVLGDTILSNTVINGTLNVGTMVFDSVNNSIDAIGTLKIQPMALGDVEFFDGLITMTKEGNIEVKEITAEKYSVAGASAGSGTLVAGEFSVEIVTSAVTDNSLIFITPKQATAYPLAVTAKTSGIGFTVEMAVTDTQDIEFDWWIVEKK